MTANGRQDKKTAHSNPEEQGRMCLSWRINFCSPTTKWALSRYFLADHAHWWSKYLFNIFSVGCDASLFKLCISWRKDSPTRRLSASMWGGGGGEEKHHNAHSRRTGMCPRELWSDRGEKSQSLQLDRLESHDAARHCRLLNHCV